jgi:hypothetical protein
MESFDLDKIDWYSPETRTVYENIDRLYSKLVRKKFPIVKLIKIDPVDFNKIVSEVNTKNYNFMSFEVIIVHICVDYLEQTDIGTVELVEGRRKILNYLVKMMGSELLEKIRFGSDTQLNMTSFCKGVIKYTY